MKKILFVPISILFLLSCSSKDDNVVLEPVKPVVTKPVKNIILMIGDGMGLTQITGARTVNGGSLNILKCRTIGLQSTHAADKYVTDSGAATTAMACGVKTNYYHVGVDPEGNPVTTILELAEKHGYSTGLVTTSLITDATPAAFYAHQVNRYEYEAIALELITKGVDFFLGGGKKYFDQRSDGLNLIDSLSAKNYFITDNLENITGFSKTAVFISDYIPLTYLEGRGDILPNALTEAIYQLKENEKGFFLMVEGAQIDWGGEDNDVDYLMAEMLDFDRAVGKALEFAKTDGNTLVVITGDHETGGFAITDGNLSQNSIQGQFITWLHTGSMVPVFAYGPGANEFAGVYENTELFYKFLEFLQLKP